MTVLAQRDLAAADLHGMAHLLPESVLRLISVIGMDATFLLIQHYGGTHFPIGKNKNRHGKVLHAALAEVVGEDNAGRISAVYADERKLWIPKCQGVLRELQHRQIRADFDNLTQGDRLPAHLAAVQLARRHGLADTTVWKILKQADAEPPADQQLPLF